MTNLQGPREEVGAVDLHLGILGQLQAVLVQLEADRDAARCHPDHQTGADHLAHLVAVEVDRTGAGDAR